MTIITLIKQVPLPSEMKMGDDGLMERTKAKSIINVDCQFGLEAGLQLKKKYPDAKMIAVSMGPQSFEKALRTAISMGYDDVYLLSDRKLGGSDTYATGLAISTLLKHLGFTKASKEPFIIFAGRQTSDGDTAHVPSQVAENLDIPQATFVERIEADDNGFIVAKRIIEGGHQMLKLPMPCVISLTPTGIAPRKPSLVGAVKARNSNVNVYGVADINLSTEKIGIDGSPTIVNAVQDIVSDRPPVMMAEGHGEKLLVTDFIAKFKTGGNTLQQKDAKVKEAKEIPDFPMVDIRNGAKGILTWAEIVNGKIARPSIELLTPAKNLATTLGEGTTITSVLIGKNVEPLAQTLFEHGADEVILVEDARLEEYLVLPFAEIFAQISKERKPEIALFAATTSGRELAPRIGVKTGSGVTADCTGLEIGQYVNRKKKEIVYPILESKRPTYGESKLATILGFEFPQVSTARAGTFELPVEQKGRTGKISTFKPTLKEEHFIVEILDTIRGAGGLQGLFDAEVIVAGGRGTVGDELALIKELAEALKKQGIKAEWAVSRVVVDAGFAEYARQIGQTGKTVRPKVYVAVGISGAIQHIAGIKESGKIVAIDHNAKASIFHHSDFGILGRYEDVLPELIEQVKGGFTFGVEPAKK
jgi:electron transfer flavoprotein alpha subunit